MVSRFGLDKVNLYLRQMAVSEYAAAQRSLGNRVCERGGAYWIRVRPFFFRPVLPYEALATERSGKSPPYPWDGYQHVVNMSDAANSVMHFRFFNHAQQYELKRLGSDWRRLVRIASRKYVVKPIRDLAEFKDLGYKAYLSFFGRTSYQYMAERTEREKFACWAENLFGLAKVNLLGGYGPTGLSAISVSYWIKDTLVYSTFFSDTHSLRDHVCDLMLHSLRELAAATPGIEQIYAGTFQGGTGPDKYYILRGCQWVKKPAIYRIPFVVRLALRAFMPTQFQKLIGHFPIEGQMIGQSAGSENSGCDAERRPYSNT